MILFITRKYPPSVGGMQLLSWKLTTEIGKLAKVQVISWGGSQAFLPLFLPYALLKAILLLLKADDVVLLLGDALLSPLGLLLKLIFRLPTVVDVHGRDVAFANPLYQLVLRACLKRMDRVVCNSAATRKECLERGVSEEKCVVIPPGIDPPDSPPSLPRSRAREVLEPLAGRSLRGKKLLLTVGRLVPRKGVAHFVAEVLPQVVKECPQVHYLIVGDGPQRREIEEQVRRRGLEDYVSLLGRVAMNPYPAIYRAADLFVMPNIHIKGDLEGFGIVALEASASGLCLVASQVDGIPDAVIHGANGILVEAGDGAAFARAILQWLADDGARRRFGIRASHFTRQHYSWDLIAQRHFQVICEAARNRGRKADLYNHP